VVKGRHVYGRPRRRVVTLPHGIYCTVMAYWLLHTAVIEM